MTSRITSSEAALGEGLAKEIEHVGIRAAPEWSEELAGSQPNDPRRVVDAIIAAVEADEPPPRLGLGQEAIEAIHEKLEAQRRELEAWADLGARAATAA